MRQAFNEILHQYSRAYNHNYRRGWQMFDIDLTGLPCGKKTELSQKGYFSKAGIRYGRQLGRVVATLYQEIISDQLYSGNAQLPHALRPLIIASEEVLGLNDYKRSCTIVRVDAGGGSLDDVNWVLGRGYQLHGKDRSSARAFAWASTVKQWYDDPHHLDRQMGWAEPLTTRDYVRLVRRLVIRWLKNNGQRAYAMLISTLEPRDVFILIGQPLSELQDQQLVASACAEFYDKRGGAIEIEFKEDKQGFGLTKRNKKRAPAQQMVMLLNSLVHNVLVWVQKWLADEVPKLGRLGTLRLVRDVLIISKLLTAFRPLLLAEQVPLILGEI
jgi:hypothetical protein